MGSKLGLAIIPIKVSLKIARPLKGMASALRFIAPNIKYDLEKTDFELDEHEYLSVALVNVLFFYLLFSVLFAFLTYSRNPDYWSAVGSGMLYASGVGAVMLFLFIHHPKIEAGKKAEEIDRNLVFALKDMLLQMSSGVSMYKSLVNVSKENYGAASKEFEYVAKHVEAGMSMETAFEQLAVRSSSEFMRKTIWQLANTIHAGASMKGALRSIIDSIVVEKKAKISDFAHELNLWTLMYMVFAVAIPTIGTTLLIILSSFAGFGITKGIFVLFIMMCLLVQVVLIGFVKSRRPVVSL